MIWGCHSFEGGKLHAIFSSHGSNSSLDARLTIIWKALTSNGIIGYIYSKEYGESRSIEKEFSKFSDYGIIHGDINHDTHIYMLELASLRTIARDGETPQEVVRRLIEEHKLMASGYKDFTELRRLYGEYMKLCGASEKITEEIKSEIKRLKESENID